MITIKQRIEDALNSFGLNLADYVCLEGIIEIEIAFIDCFSLLKFEFYGGELTIHEYVASALRANNIKRHVVVKGIASSTGHPYDNMILTQKRPKAAIKFEQILRKRFGATMQFLWNYDDESDLWCLEIWILKFTQPKLYIDKELSVIENFACRLADKNKDRIRLSSLYATQRDARY